MPTAAEIIKLNDQNLADYEINDVFNQARLFQAAEAVESSNGTQHKYLKETGAPTVGFRQANAGRDNGNGTRVAVTTDLKIVDCSFEIDKALADGYKDGAEAYIQKEAPRYLRAGFFGVESAMINGDQTDGFDGLQQAVPDTSTYYVDAEGTSDAESVYLAYSAEEAFALVANEELEIGESYITRAVDSSGKPFDVYRTPILGWMTIQLGGVADVVRIDNVSAEAGKGLTDDLLYEAAAKMPAGRAPNMVICSRTTQEQLRKSRVATNALGTPVPTPTDVPGIGQIVVSDIRPNIDPGS